MFKNMFKRSQHINSSELNQKNYQSLLLALSIVLLPHFFYMPVSISILMVSVLFIWQVLLWKKGSYQQAQHKIFQYFVMFLGLALIYSQFGTFLGVDAGCAALALILLGKAFEIKTYRDAIILVNFALFVLASIFLYGQEIYLAIVAFIGVLVCLYSMYQLQNYNNAYEEVLIQDVSTQQIRQQAIKTVVKLVLLATPFMVLLFMFFPRIPPLWSVPQPSNVAKTGVSDEMSPGDIANLSQSSELAFRVVFDNFQQMPAKSQLYWRAIVLEQFDGVRWKQNYQTKFSQPIRFAHLQQAKLPSWYSVPKQNTAINAVPYQVIYEPSFQIWAYALEHSIATHPLAVKKDLTVQFDMELIKRRRVALQFLKPHPFADLDLDVESRAINTRLEDTTLNPRSQAFAQQMWEKYPDPHAYSQAILKWIKAENFSYTLSPPLLRGDRVDDFLFRTRAGFCEHYASAYVNLMRMVGIPSRVVTGYQGGQWAPDGKSWEVRQLDAHAWTEVWFAGKGWVRVDPTAAIAPERVELGMQQFSQQNAGLFGDEDNALWQAQKYQWLAKSRIWLDYANYQWQSKIVGFDRDNQQSWLKKLSIDNLSQQLIFLIIGLVCIIGLMVWWLARQQRIKMPKLDQYLNKLSLQLAKHDLQRLEHEPVLTWLSKLEQQYGQNPRLTEMKQLYSQHTYIAPLSAAQLNYLYDLIIKYAIEVKRIEKS